MNFKLDIIEAYKNAYNKNPGLEKFNNCKKWLLWGMFGIAVLQKLFAVILLFDKFSFALLIGALIGLCIHGIFAIAVYRGPWKFSFIFYLLFIHLLFDLIKNGIPALVSGIEYVPIFYIMMAVETFYAVYLLFLALWLTVPSKNRTYAQIINDVFKECSQKFKEFNNMNRP